MVLKGSKTSLWTRNIQLSLIGVVLGLGPVMNDWADISTQGRGAGGFFHGYNGVVWMVVVLHAGGGLLVAMVVKYADNILKGFATSLSILFSCVVSYFLFDFRANSQFAMGAACVLYAAYSYGSAPAQKGTDPSPPPAAAAAKKATQLVGTEVHSLGAIRLVGEGVGVASTDVEIGATVVVRGGLE